MYQLILASESPRRRHLLETSGFVFDVHPVKVSETPDKNLNIDEQILDIAGRKAKAAFEELKSTSHKNFLLLTADTMVVYHTQTLGKPRNQDEAYEFLKLLSGKTHEVKTGLCLVESLGGQKASHIETSRVTFKTLSDDEIWTYIQSGEPMDKAGAYAIQGLGKKFVAEFNGDYDNVVGLPVKAFENLLVKMNWTVERVKQ
ncbi:Maf family protein [Bdellovibrio sp. HCB337]|uniref:Maf family protein n=1 Tax=Bdellovibrio sp. HCB337 TaxID=3394358 RepID=UPI0039A41AFA